MKLNNYPFERISLPSIYSRLTPEERTVRDEIMRQIIASGSPVGSFHIRHHGPDMHSKIDVLAEKRVIVLNANGDIVCAYPVSALPTHHKVRLADGKEFFAMCAVDALGAAFAFAQDIAVDSRCSRCHAPVHVVIREGSLAEFSPPGLHVLHADLNKSDNWAMSC